MYGKHYGAMHDALDFQWHSACSGQTHPDDARKRTRRASKICVGVAINAQLCLRAINYLMSTAPAR